jgi:hypothetical protein
MYNLAQYRRMSERKMYSAEVSFSTDKFCFPAVIRNLSKGGALIENDAHPTMKVGNVIIISIPFQVKEGCVKMKATVMWAEKCQFGVKFNQAISASDPMYN